MTTALLPSQGRCCLRPCSVLRCYKSLLPSTLTAESAALAAASWPSYSTDAGAGRMLPIRDAQHPALG